MAPKKRKADEEAEPAKSPVESTRMVTRGSEAAARRQTRSSTQGGDAKSVKPVPKKPAAARKKSKKKKEEAKSDEEVDKVEDEEVNTKTIVIERWWGISISSILLGRNYESDFLLFYSIMILILLCFTSILLGRNYFRFRGSSDRFPSRNLYGFFEKFRTHIR